MRRDTLLALNAINRAFYSTHAGAWSATRRGPWRGFERALPRIEGALPARGARILDVGCGHGRFADALLAALDRPFAYLGVDASGALLAEARARHPGHGAPRFVEHDFVAGDLEPVLGEGAFHAILLLGVLHHVPGAATRRRLLAECASRLAPGGVLVLTLWRFEQLERLRRRVLPWEALPARGGPVLDPADLEPGDRLLRFGDGGALRYCHAFGDDDPPLSGVPLEPVDRWLADGETGELNRWIVLRPGP